MDLAAEYRRYLAEHQHPWNRATHFVGIPIIVGSLLVCPPLGAWTALLGAQVVGWAFQLAGHRIEGNRPALLKRPISLLIGPLMVLVEIAEMLGVHVAFARQARADRAP